MSVKSCVYKDCENFTIAGIAPTENQFTLFAFPKDPLRRNCWMQMGEVPNHLPPNDLLMCSDHFDKKYMSINQRRTILLRTAVPFPCTAPNAATTSNRRLVVSKPERVHSNTYERETTTFLVCKDEELNEELCQIELADDGEMEAIATAVGSDDEDIDHDVVHEEEEEAASTSTLNDDEVVLASIPLDAADYQVESTMPEVEEQAATTIRVVAVASPRTIIRCDKNTPSSSQLNTPPRVASKRKLSISTTTTAEGSRGKPQQKSLLPPIKKINVMTKSLKEGARVGLITNRTERRQAFSVVNDADDDLNGHDGGDVDGQNVTTFIFKGEEYVQMSKEFYLNEKRELCRKLRRYEGILKQIKLYISDLDLDEA